MQQRSTNNMLLATNDWSQPKSTLTQEAFNVDQCGPMRISQYRELCEHMHDN